MESVLSKVMELEALRYEYDATKMNGLPSGAQIGLSAQNVEQVFPECVRDVAMPVIDKSGNLVKDAGGNVITNNYKAINYDEMIPVLISAIKEQQQQINELKAQVGK